MCYAFFVGYVPRAHCVYLVGMTAGVRKKAAALCDCLILFGCFRLYAYGINLWGKYQDMQPSCRT